MLNEEGVERYFHHPEQFVTDKANCMASWFFVQILADGGVNVYSRCHNEVVGNVNNQTMKEIWGGDRMREWRDFIRKTKKMPMCKRCDLIFFDVS